MKELMKSYAKQHSFAQIIAVTSIIGMAACGTGAAWFYFNVVDKLTNATYVSKGGKVYKAELQNGYDYPERDYEITQAVKEFHLNRFTGDRYSVDDNIAAAMELCGDCSEAVIRDYDDEGMERNIKEKGWTYQAYVDSVSLNEDGMSGFVFGKQAIRSNSQEIYRNLYLSFSARSVSRSDANLLGVLIDHVEVFNNKVIEVTKY
jgi:hypothetical protein